jgi:DNA mismatch endonuclease (patch repair protein)
MALHVAGTTLKAKKFTPPPGTSPLALRKILHSRGLRYRVDHAPIPGVRRRADVVFTRLRIAVFVDGCFWHGCPEHATVPKSNADYWVPKLQRNIERDRETDAVLMSHGWSVLRIWEHVPSAEAADRVAAEVIRRRLENDGD